MNDPVLVAASIRERIQRIRNECDGVYAQFGVSSWEKTFMADLESRQMLSDRQEETLCEIERKVFG